jgi:hypothetical protein
VMYKMYACCRASARGRNPLHVRDDCARGLRLPHNCSIPLQPLASYINQREALVASVGYLLTFKKPER